MYYTMAINDYTLIPALLINCLTQYVVAIKFEFSCNGGCGENVSKREAL